jgi:hypothetical protein
VLTGQATKRKTTPNAWSAEAEEEAVLRAAIQFMILATANRSRGPD